MTATGRHRGHLVHWDGAIWRYDDGTPATAERPCVECGVLAEPGAPDPCIGMLPGVSSACCGHGVEAPYVVREEAVMARERADQKAGSEGTPS